MSSFIRKNKEGKYNLKTNQENIKRIVYKYYKEWMREKEIDLDEIKYNSEWRHIYSPKRYIDGRIYDNLMNEITLKELNQVISKAKNNKVPDVSGIPYNFWKKSKQLTRNLLLAICNETIDTSECLDEWKKGIIFPINKMTRSFWNQDLNLTHPITLIEIRRKLFLKILIKRLSTILTKKRVLQGSNYAALKNKSML